MMKNHQCKTAFSFVAFVMALLVLPATAAEVPNPLPDPDGKPADQSKPVKVFILLGQSNMLGFGRIGPEDQKGTLEHLTKKEGKYPHLVDDEGKWTQRTDVRYVQVMHNRGAMATLRNEWLTVNGQVSSGRPHSGPIVQEESQFSCKKVVD